MKKIFYFIAVLVCTAGCINHNVPAGYANDTDTTDFKRCDDDSVVYVDGWGLIHMNVIESTVCDE